MTKEPKKHNKVSRIIFRCSPEDYQIIEKAAALDGRKLPDFLRFHLREASDAIILKKNIHTSITCPTRHVQDSHGEHAFFGWVRKAVKEGIEEMKTFIKEKAGYPWRGFRLFFDAFFSLQKRKGLVWII